MKNLAFHSLLRWKMTILPDSYYLTHFSSRSWENVLVEAGSGRVNHQANAAAKTAHKLVHKPKVHKLICALHLSSWVKQDWSAGIQRRSVSGCGIWMRGTPTRAAWTDGSDFYTRRSGRLPRSRTVTQTRSRNSCLKSGRSEQAKRGVQSVLAAGTTVGGAGNTAGNTLTPNFKNYILPTC